MKKPRIKKLSSYQKKKIIIDRLLKEQHDLRTKIIKLIDNPKDKELLQYFRRMSMEMKLGAMAPKHSVLAWLKALGAKNLKSNNFNFYEHTPE